MTWYPSPALATGLVALALAQAAPAAAHPHVLINMSADVVFNDEGLIRAVNTEWIFDPEYSVMATEGLDTNKDGVLTSDELQPLATENIQALKDYRYFVYAKTDGQKVNWKDVTEYTQLMGVDGRLRMYFTVELPEPVDPAKHEFLFRIYDPSFFIAMEFEGDKPVEVLGKIPASCQVKVEEPPDLNETSDTRAMLATKGADWQPEDEEDFGIMFAQPVAVTCTKTQ
jgi:ABC-type uncharacterized transport system substrate-binding protein